MVKFAASILATAVLSASMLPAEPAHGATGEEVFNTGTAGVGPLVDVVQDLGIKNDSPSNSWYATGYFNASGHKLSYLYHVLLINAPGFAVVVQNVSITDSTTGAYHGESVTTPLSQANVSPSGLNIAVPTGSISGTFDDLHVVATLAGGKFDLHLKAGGPALFNGGTGILPVQGVPIQQYSVPTMATSGTITLDGTSYTVTGNSWFDRQWNTVIPAVKWTWMGLHLANGDSLSVWSAVDPALGKSRAWATILHADGSQSTAAVEPTLGATDPWTSDISGNRYPGRWTVRIPQFNAVLAVTPKPLKQEVWSPGSPIGPNYQGASAIAGTYKGAPIVGVGRVEVLGVWP